MLTGNFIFIFEGGSAKHEKTVSDEDLESADAGLLEVIDIGNPEVPRTYYGGEWELLPGSSPFE